MKRLFLLRHAKTEQADKDTPADADRVLTERGRTDAPLVGREMRRKGYRPDLILCSPSARTRQTLELARAEFGGSAEIRTVDSIYAAGANDIVALLRKLPRAVERPMVVGHNPSFEEAAALLVGEAGPAKFESLGEKFPTAALAVIDFDIDHWKAVEPGGGVLADFIKPKDLR
jgi:phosphohistidine phosphatase